MAYPASEIDSPVVPTCQWTTCQKAPLARTWPGSPGPVPRSAQAPCCPPRHRPLALLPALQLSPPSPLPPRLSSACRRPSAHHPNLHQRPRPPWHSPPSLETRLPSRPILVPAGSCSPARFTGHHCDHRHHRARTRAAPPPRPGPFCFESPRLAPRRCPGPQGPGMPVRCCGPGCQRLLWCPGVTQSRWAVGLET
jgi:hypothetical protein